MVSEGGGAGFPCYDRGMSVGLRPDGVPSRLLPRPIREIAATTRIDPRITELVPGFDAPFFQAGLAGYSDGAMRLVARSHGCPFCVTEALLDRTLVNGGKGRRKEDPDLIASECGMGDLTDNRAAGLDDHPIAGQIMGTDPGEMAEGASILLGMGYDVIDVNLACPVKKIKKKARGGHFLAHPDQAIAVLEAVRGVAGTVPVTVKLRRAWDDSATMAASFERIFDAAYDLGCAWTTVHCRTVEQRYIGPGRWEFLRDLRDRHPDRIFFGSGDVWTVEDIFAMIALTGVSGVSVARGCIGNPWIFRQARDLMRGEEPAAPMLDDQRRTLEQHLEFARVIHGERVASRQMRKFGIKFAALHPRPDLVKRAFIEADSMEAWSAVIERFYASEEAVGIEG